MAVMLKIRNLTKQNDEFIFEEIVFDKSEFIYVEDMVFRVTCSLGISNVYAHLFAFYYRPEGVWLCPNQELAALPIDLNLKDSLVELDLRIRFRPLLDELNRCDSKALDYYFYQIRDEFLNLNLKKGKYNEEDHLRIMVGIAMQDVMRIVLENNIGDKEISNYLQNIYDYCPRKPKIFSYYSIKRPNHPYSFRQKLINKFYNCFNRDLDVNTIKYCYIEQYFEFLEKADFTSPMDEIYDIDITSLKTITQEHKKQIIYHSERHCLSTRVLNTKTWTPLLPIKELMSIMVLDDAKLQIYHEKAAPLVITMLSPLHLKSFISLLSGYRHLCEHWNFNICTKYFSPFLDRLQKYSCFGPIESSVVHGKIARFQRELSNKKSWFVFQQKLATNFSTFKIAYEKDHNLEYCKIEFDILAKNPIFRFEENVFYRHEDLMNYVKQKKNLDSMIAPKENDIYANLLLCRNKQTESKTETNGLPLVIAKAEELTRTRLTLTNHVNFSIMLGTYTTSQGKAKVMIKEFTTFTSNSQILKEIEDWIHLKESSIVNGKGLILNPLTVLLEHCPNTLRELYQNKDVTLHVTNRIEAVYSLAKALEYLFTKGMVHGYIRFDNLYVSTFNGKYLSIKLGDPIGFDADRDRFNQRAWLSPEYLNFNSPVYSKVTSYLDVWAFATTLWEIFNNGEKPGFGHEEVEISLDSLLNMIPTELARIVKDCWSKDYNYRIQASSILRDMCQILAVVYERQKRETAHDYCHIAGEPELEPPDKPLPSNGREYSFASHVSKITSFPKKYFYRSGSTSSMVSGQTDTTTLPQDDTISLLQSNEDEFKIYDDPLPKGQVQLTELIGKGTYGFVFKSLYSNDCYAAKTIIEDNNVDFDEEIRIMSKVKHNNIIKIFRCAKIGIEQILPLLAEDDKLLFCKKVPSANGYVKYEPVISECKAVLMELVDIGALNDYISRIYLGGDSDLPLKMLKYAHDIASGLEYLASKNIIHRDLATRNILITSKQEVKISDFGLAHILEGDHYKYRRQLKLPILWYAPESLTKCIFGIKSDVWSFGVLLWELYTYCQENPYSELNLDFKNTNPDILLKILSDKLTNEGIRLNRPPDCSKQLYELMLDCWHFKPENRPDPSTILARLKDLCIYSAIDLY